MGHDAGALEKYIPGAASRIEATSYAREARVYSAVLVRAAAVCMGRSQHADGAEALAIVSDTPPAKILVSGMRGSHELKLILDGG